MKRGDATTHLNARNIAASTVVSKTGSKWLATTGTGSLLSFLNSRSMKIALMPLPIHMDPQQKEEVGKYLEKLLFAAECLIKKHAQVLYLYKF